KKNHKIVKKVFIEFIRHFTIGQQPFNYKYTYILYQPFDRYVSQFVLVYYFVFCTIHNHILLLSSFVNICVNIVKCIYEYTLSVAYIPMYTTILEENMVYEDLFIPGTELSELKLSGFWDWFINVSDVRVHWKYEPTYILSQCAYLFGGLATLIHACIRGGRLPYLWVSIMIHGVVVESLSYLMPDVDNFWHSQTPVMFLGKTIRTEIKRLGRPIPDLIISKTDVGKSRNYSRNFNSSVYDRFKWLCGCPKRNKLFCFICLVMGGNQSAWTQEWCVGKDPCFIYNSSVAVAKMRLPKWSEPFAVGLGVVLIDIPYDIISVNFLHWTWHDTDPNIYDRHYWVPWNSYYFHATFAASFTFWFHFSREKICSSGGKWISDKSIVKEVLCCIIPGILGTVGGVIMFIPVYHPLHDIYKLHSEVTFMIIFAIFLLLIWSGDRKPRNDEFSKKNFSQNPLDDMASGDTFDFTL
ncbi:hypothetical protein NQ318_005054, partial [Aromia moschata]